MHKRKICLKCSPGEKMKGCWLSRCDGKDDCDEEQHEGLMGPNRIWSAGDFDQNSQAPPQGSSGEGRKLVGGHGGKCFPKPIGGIACFLPGQVSIHFCF